MVGRRRRRVRGWPRRTHAAAVRERAHRLRWRELLQRALGGAAAAVHDPRRIAAARCGALQRTAGARCGGGRRRGGGGSGADADSRNRARLPHRRRRAKRRHGGAAGACVRRGVRACVCCARAHLVGVIAAAVRLVCWRAHCVCARRRRVATSSPCARVPWSLRRARATWMRGGTAPRSLRCAGTAWTRISCTTTTRTRLRRTWRTS